MTTEQIALLVTAIVGFLQVLTVAIGIWNKAHITAIREEQARVASDLAGVKQNGKELSQLLNQHTRQDSQNRL